MRVESLKIENFRRIKRAEIKFSPGLNVFCGGNAQGKTSILRALRVLSGEENRFQPECLRFGQKNFFLKGKFVGGEGVKSEVIAFYSDGQGRRLVNGKEKSGGEVKKKIPLVSLDTESIGVVKGEPEMRRRFLDELILHLKPHYPFLKAAYFRALHQRQKALFDLNCFNRESLSLYLDELENVMSQQGAKITRYRAEVTEKLKKKAGGPGRKECLKGEVSLEYHPVAEGDENEVRELIRQKLFNNRELDKERGRTVFGPHLDELKIYLDGKPARAFASEGEKKGIAAFLIISAWEIIAEETGETPLLLIDDFPSVLDEQSAASLIAFLKGKSQVILTMTSQQPQRLGLKDLEGENRLFLVKEGEVRTWNILEPK